MKLRPYRNGPLLPTAFCLLLTALLALPGPAAGQAPTERILSFHSDIVVHEDASMSVTETITVRATGAQIRRGIFRDFPTRYTDALRNNYVVDFQVLDVLRDGRPEPYRVEGVANGKRVYVGREDVFLESGRYTYTLTYRTDRQLGFFEAHDELYWNVTGNGWVFPIDRASARVVLPANIPRDQLRLDAYTGAQGGRDQDYEVARDLAGEPTFSTTKPLDKFEGLTLVVGWPKGYVQEPMAARRLEYFVRDNPAAVVGVPGLLLVLVYFLWRWSQVGKDPARGAIIPLYSPPDGFSPAAVRYIRRMGFDQQTFTASVLNMAVGGFVKLSQRAKTYTLQRDSGDISGLEPEETAAAEKLLGDGDRLSVSRSNYRKVQEALEATKKSLDQRFGRGYFDKNHDDFLVGLGLSILVALIVLVLSGTVGTLFFLPLLLIPVGIAVFGWRMAATERNRIVGAGKALFLTLFALPFVGVGRRLPCRPGAGGNPHRSRHLRRPRSPERAVLRAPEDAHLHRSCAARQDRGLQDVLDGHRSRPHAPAKPARQDPPALREVPALRGCARCGARVGRSVLRRAGASGTGGRRVPADLVRRLCVAHRRAHGIRVLPGELAHHRYSRVIHATRVQLGR